MEGVVLVLVFVAIAVTDFFWFRYLRRRRKEREAEMSAEELRRWRKRRAVLLPIVLAVLVIRLVWIVHNH